MLSIASNIIYIQILIFLSFKCRTTLEMKSYAVSMFPRIICTSVIYSWSIPKMLSDPICQSEKESVRDSTSLTLVYQIFYWWDIPVGQQDISHKLSLFRVLEIQYCLLSHGTNILGSRVYSLLRYGVLCERWVSSMFFFPLCQKMRIERGSIPPSRHPIPISWSKLGLQCSLINSPIAEIVVSGGMSMPQVLSTLDSSISVDRSWSERSWGWRK